MKYPILIDRTTTYVVMAEGDDAQDAARRLNALETVLLAEKCHGAETTDDGGFKARAPEAWEDYWYQEVIEFVSSPIEPNGP